MRSNVLQCLVVGGYIPMYKSVLEWL